MKAMSYNEFKTLCESREDHMEAFGWRIVFYDSYYRAYKVIEGSFSGTGMYASALYDSHSFVSLKKLFSFIKAN